MLGKIECRKRRGRQRMRRLDGINISFLSKLQETEGQRSLADYSPWGRKESDTTEATEHAHVLSRKIIFLNPRFHPLKVTPG